MENDVQKRVEEIDKRIEDLKEHQKMWSNAGGVGGSMAMMATSEINELELEKNDLINGTHELEIYRTQKKIKQLEYLKSEANFLKRIKYNRDLKAAQEMLGNLEGRKK